MTWSILREDYHFAYILDEHGEPTPTEDHQLTAQWLCGKERKRRKVAETCFVYRGHHYCVSTVFTMYNLQGREGPPILWQTMVFSRDRLVREIQERYMSRREAEEGHKIVVDAVREGLRRCKRRPSPRRKQVARRRRARGESVLGKAATR